MTLTSHFETTASSPPLRDHFAAYMVSQLMVRFRKTELHIRRPPRAIRELIFLHHSNSILKLFSFLFCCQAPAPTTILSNILHKQFKVSALIALFSNLPCSIFANQWMSTTRIPYKNSNDILGKSHHYIVFQLIAKNFN